jgi:hypothetical protein
MAEAEREVLQSGQRPEKFVRFRQNLVPDTTVNQSGRVNRDCEDTKP